MSSQSYSALLSGMWAPEGSDINKRLQKLQALEKMRKERELQRQMSQSTNNSRGLRNRIRSNQAESENDPAGINYLTKQFESQIENPFGGARPKFAGSSQEETVQDWDQMFKSVTGEILNRPEVDTQSSFRRDRLGRSDSGDSSSGYESRYRSSFRTYERPSYTSSRYNRSNSQPEEQTEDIFAGVTESILGRVESGPNYSLNLYEPQSYSRRKYGKENEEIVNIDDEQQMENGEHHTEEVIEILDDDDDNEEPVHFIERLKKGPETIESSSEFNLSQKRSVTNGFPMTNLPTVPPLKKLKPGETDADNDNEQYDDVTQYIHPVEDIIAVAKDINAAFGNKSPKQNTNEISLNFSFENNGIAENNKGEFVFTASTPDSAVPKQRTSGTKRKQRPSTKGKSSSFDSTTKSTTEETPLVDNNIDETDATNSSVVYEAIYLPEDSFAAEREELAAETRDLYKSRFSEYMNLDQTTGQLDQMQEFFSGQAVKGDPVIWRVLDGEKVEEELAKPVDDSSPKGKRTEKEKDKQSEMSIGDKLIKLKSMTDEKSKRFSKKGSEKRENDISDKHDESQNGELETEDVRKSLSPNSVSESPRGLRNDPEVKISPRDLVKDVRELKKFIRESVSEPSTPVLEKQLSIDKRTVKEISTQTDFTDGEYICKHCGKSSSEIVESRKKPEASYKNTKLDLRVETKNPGQSYAALEKKHLAEIKKEMKVSNSKPASEADSNKPVAAGKVKSTASAPSYMKSTASSSIKSNGSIEKARKGSAPDIYKVKEMEAQRTKSPVGFLRGGKSLVAQRAKVFDSSNTKTNGKQKTKPGLSLYRGSSVDRQKSEDASSKGERTKSTILKSKSCEQMHALSEDRLVNKKDVNSKKLVKQKSVENKLEQSVEDLQTDKSVEKKLEQAVESMQTEKSADSNVPPSAGIKRTRAQMTQKSVPPAVSPKPIRKIESGLVSPISVSPLRSKESYKPPTGIHTGAEHAEQHCSRRVETDGQFTKLQDNPFIKNDTRRRNSLRERKESESVWERERSRSRESSLKRSNTSAGERSSLTHLSWSDSGSTESLPASVSSFQRSRSERLGSVSSVTSQNSMLNLLDPKGTKTDVVTGMKETNVDEAYKEYISSRNNSEASESPDNDKNDSGLIEFAQKACSLLEFEPKKRDSSSDSAENDGKVNSNPTGNSTSHVATNGTSHLKNGVAESSTAAPDKTGKKSKQKKGFFKGRLFSK